MILCIGTTPASQRVMVFPQLRIDHVNRAAITIDGAAGKSVNVAKVLNVLGEQALALGFLGGAHGEEIRSILAAQGIRMDFVSVQTPTRQCITVVDEAAGTITELVEESRPVTAGDYEQLADRVRRHAPGCRAMVMSGTLAPGGSPEFYRRCIDIANGVGKLTVLDAQGPALTLALTARPGLVKPNRPELAATVGHELSGEAAVVAAMRELADRGAQRVVVTAGKDPTLALDGQTVWRIISPWVKALSPIGSGDAFTAAMVLGLLRGDDLGEACRWGSAAGAANALTWMSGEVRREDLDRLVRDVQVEKV